MPGLRVGSPLPACALLALLAALVPAHAGQVLQVVGSVAVRHAGNSVPAAASTAVAQDDEIETAPQSEALLEFEDGSRLLLQERTTIKLEDYLSQGEGRPLRMRVLLRTGKLRYVSGKVTEHRSVGFRTPSATIGIRGTDLQIVLAGEDGPVPSGTYVRVIEGGALLAGETGSVELAPLQTGVSLDRSARTRAINNVLVRRVGNVPSALFEGARLDGLLR